MLLLKIIMFIIPKILYLSLLYVCRFGLNLYCWTPTSTAQILKLVQKANNKTESHFLLLLFDINPTDN